MYFSDISATPPFALGSNNIITTDGEPAVRTEEGVFADYTFSDAPEIRVLIIESSLSDATILVEAVERAGFLLDYRIVQCRDHLVSALLAEVWDVIVCTIVLPALPALEALMLTRDHDKIMERHTPFILIAPPSSIQQPSASPERTVDQVANHVANHVADHIVELLQAGADNVFTKGNIERFIRSIRSIHSIHSTRRVDVNLPGTPLRTNAQGATEEQFAEHSLYESEQQYRTLVDNLTEGVIIVDTENRVVIANPAAERAFGVEPSGLAERMLDEFIDDDVRNILVNHALPAHTDDVQGFEIEIVRQNGTRRWQSVRSMPRFNGEGVLLGIFVIFNDITERKNSDDANVLFSQFLERRINERTEALKKANAELEYEIYERKRIEAMLVQSGERLNSLLQNSSDVITIINESGLIQYESPATEHIFGFDIRNRVGRNFADNVHPSCTEEFQQMLLTITGSAETDAASGTQRMELLYGTTKKRDDYVWIEISAGNQLHNPAVNGIVLNSWDISARKVAEEELKRALQQEKELNDLKSRFITMVSHEFRTPLTVINSSAEILRLGAGKVTPEKQIMHIDRMMIAGSRIEQMLNDVLVLARGESGTTRARFVPVALNEFCSGIVSELQQALPSASAERRIFYTFESSTVMAPYLDEKLLRSIVTNLLSNALKYSALAVRLDVSCTTETITIRVEDYGIGIPDDDQKHIFEAFHRANNALSVKGTGLGMSIVKYAVESHDGTVTFKSEQGLGTIFTVHLPFRTSVPSESPYIA